MAEGLEFEFGYVQDFLFYSVQAGAHRPSYTVGTVDVLPGIKATGEFN
jgi:hypothetical protein